MASTVHLFCGLPWAGKTFLAKRLEAEREVVRFTLDHWMLSLYGGTLRQQDYAAAAHRVKGHIWDLGRDLLKRNLDIALDWSLWNPDLRSLWVEMIAGVEANHVLYYLDVPLNEIVRRMCSRSERSETELCFAHDTDYQRSEVNRFFQYFIPPSAEEKLNLLMVHDPVSFEFPGETRGSPRWR